jgi:molecular chaperone DnaK (HSP70)
MFFPSQNIDQHTEITEENGKKMPALDVFAAAINHLKSDLLSMCEKQHSQINPESIRWVITIPALWSDKAKFFMRQAGQEVRSNSNM